MSSRIVSDEKVLRTCSPDRSSRTSFRGSPPEIRTAASSALQQRRGQCEDPRIAAAVFSDGHGAEEDLGRNLKRGLFARYRYREMGRGTFGSRDDRTTCRSGGGGT